MDPHPHQLSTTSRRGDAWRPQALARVLGVGTAAESFRTGSARVYEVAIFGNSSLSFLCVPMSWELRANVTSCAPEVKQPQPTVHTWQPSPPASRSTAAIGAGEQGDHLHDHLPCTCGKGQGGQHHPFARSPGWSQMYGHASNDGR